MESVRELAIEAWIPAAPNITDPEDAVFASFGRLAAGASIDDARAELAVISARLAATNPDLRGRSTSAAPLLETVVRGVRTELRFLFATVLVILAVTCVNLVNLFLTNASGRRIELTMRVALGATRMHLVRQTVTEALLVAGAGGAAGLLLALWAVPVLIAIAPPTVPRLNEITIDRSMLAFAAVVSAGVGLVCGIAACLPFDIRNVATVLGRARTTAPIATSRFRRTLIVAEVALSLMLLIAAALMVRTVRQVAGLDLGFRPSNVVAASLGSSRIMTRAERLTFQTTILDGVRALPGVSEAGIGLGPLRGGMGLGGARVPGDPRDFGILRVDSVSAGYFEALGARLIAGRFFVPDDARDPRGYVIVNETAARLLWGVADPIGKVLIKNVKGNEQLTVVGVVANMRTTVFEVKPEPTLYFVYMQDQNFSAMTMLVRTDGNTERLVPAIRGIIRRVDPDHPFSGVELLETRIDRELAPRVFVLRAVGLFSLLSVVLAVVGIYGVVAESVAHRVREIGVRMAMGAGAHDILRLILGQGARLIALGIVLGLAGAIALRGVMRSFVFGVETLDPLSYAAACALLIATTLAACALPARRAAHLDPAAAIREGSS
jgi:predicted permease